MMRRIKLVFLFILPTLLWAQHVSFALEQINGQVIIDKGLTGKGVKIGIIDGGFLGAKTNISLKNHFDQDRVDYYKDFVTPDQSPFSGSIKMDDGHGTEVWQMIGGYHPTRKVQYGLATQSIFYLARTDHERYEKRLEEKYLIDAMNEMISDGVKIINISLGYTDGYSNRDENYTRDQIDGKSTWITRSMDSVLAIHDVLVIVSAGNDGNNRWRTLSAPADSRYVLTVGATKLNPLEEMEYSAKGAEVLDYVKPDISCYSTNGTSFSAPIITGLAACLMEYDTTLSVQEIKSLLIRSSNFYPYPNNYTGYGVPNADFIFNILDGHAPKEVSRIDSDKNKFSMKENSAQERTRSIIYHKDNWRVIKKDIVRWKNRVKIRRFEASTQMSVLTGKNVIEIFWTAPK